jgi:hypothetical protein
LNPLNPGLSGVVVVVVTKLTLTIGELVVVFG